MFGRCLSGLKLKRPSTPTVNSSACVTPVRNQSVVEGGSNEVSPSVIIDVGEDGSPEPVFNSAYVNGEPFTPREKKTPGKKSPNRKIPSPEGLGERRKQLFGKKSLKDTAAQWDVESPCHMRNNGPTVPEAEDATAKAIDQLLASDSFRENRRPSLPRALSSRKASTDSQGPPVSMVAVVPLVGDHRLGGSPDKLQQGALYDRPPHLDLLRWLLPYFHESCLQVTPVSRSAEGLQLQWEKSMMAATVESSYTGPHLTFPLVDHGLAAFFRHLATNTNVPLHQKYTYKLLDSALNVLKAQPRVAELTLTDNRHRQLIMVGELKGQLQDLLHIFQQYKSPVAGTMYLFVGDCPGCGANPIEVMLLLFAFKVVYPKSVFWVGGAVDDPTCTASEALLREQMVQRYGGEVMYTKLQEARRALPVAAFFEGQIVAVHCGLLRPNVVPLSVLTGQVSDPGHMLPRPRWQVILSEFLWGEHTDPNPVPVRFRPDVGPDLIRRLRMVITSHELPRTGRGYEITHDGRLVVLLSASNAMGRVNSPGAVLVFTPGALLDFTLQEHLVWGSDVKEETALCDAPIVRQSDLHVRPPEEVLALVRRDAALRKADLAWLFHVHEVSPNIISVEMWRLVMTTVLGFVLPWFKFEPDLIPDAPQPMVDYETFLKHLSRLPPPASNWKKGATTALHDALIKAEFTLPELAQIFDRRGEGRVTAETLNEVLQAVEIKLNPDQVVGLLWDSVNSSHVDVLTFLESLRVRPADLDPNLASLLRSLSDMLVVLDPFWDTLTIFKAMETRGTGRIHVNDFVTGVTGLMDSCEEQIKRRQDSPSSASTFRADSITPASIRQLARAMDPTASGTIGYLSFADFLGRPRCGAVHMLERLCRHIHATKAPIVTFRDARAKGGLPLGDVKEWLRGCAPYEEEPDVVLDSLVAFMDIDCDGRISYEDFCQAFYFVDGVQADNAHQARHAAHYSQPGPRLDPVPEDARVPADYLLERLRQSHARQRNNLLGR